LELFSIQKSFFLTGKNLHNKFLTNQLTKELKKIATKNHVVTMCKDDKIFICSQPIRRGIVK